jgi:hypothetical protein
MLGVFVRAQSPTGAIVGLVTDPSGAAVTGARVIVLKRDTGQSRTAATSPEGRYDVEALAPGDYTISAELTGFRRLARAAIVQAGTTTTVNVALEVGDVRADVTVSGAAPLLQHEHHQVTGLVTRIQIEDLPLNGRNFLELAKLEPGVTNPVRADDNRFFVSALGAGVQTIPRVGYTAITVDGANVSTPGTIGTILQVSQDVVQEFQLSTVNFDLTTSPTTNGAVNVVTRSGTNAYHGSVFDLYRDHHLAAYPGLSRDPRTPDPFFQRNQAGASGGGPLRKDRLFFFGSYERTDQRGVVSVQPRTASVAPLGGIFPTPYSDTEVSARVDASVGRRHTIFASYNHDANGALAPVANALPSAWARRNNRGDQVLTALTSSLSQRLVNDLRFSYFSTKQVSNPSSADDCAGCFGLGVPQIAIPDANITFGAAGRLAALGARYQLTDDLTAQRGNHRLRVGADVQHTVVTASTLDRDPAQITLWSAEAVRQLNPAIPLPSSFTTVADILQLPLRSFSTAVGPGTVLWRDFSGDRVGDLYRFYGADTWNVRSRLTVNAGLAWSYEPNVLNSDMTKPTLLEPILGANRLNSPRAELANFAPALGFVWSAGSDGRTVVRGGAGRYFDPAASTNALNLANERVELNPVGTGRLTVSGSNITVDGHILDFPSPTAFTGAQLLSVLPAIRANLLASIAPDNRDFSIRNIDRTKQGSNLYDPDYKTPSAVHMNIGVQRALGAGFVAGADVVWKWYSHTFINGIDYNRWGSTTGPVIPACTPAQQSDVTALCSNGNLYFDTTIGRAQYRGLLVRIERRFSGRAQFLASYALSSYVGTNGTGTGTTEAAGGRVFGFNNDDWFENYGPMPTDRRHVLNVSGIVVLPWALHLSTNIAADSAPPFSAYIDSMDFNGDGTRNDLLPRTLVNQFGRSLSRQDLVRLVAAYNATIAGHPTTTGIAPVIKLPGNYAFDESFFTQDLRLTRTFVLPGRHTRLLLFADVFNLFNTPNLVQYSENLRNPATFGQPAARFTQVFGSGGPRAFQFGITLRF